MSTKMLLFNISKGSAETKFVPYFIYKPKMKRSWKKICQYFFLGQNSFSPFLKNTKNTKQILIFNFIFDNCSLM